MTVYLVGAGPGDPGLLTLRGAEVLGTADVVIYGRPSVRDLLDLAPADAELIGLGEMLGGSPVPQEEVTRLLIDHGRTGRSIVRLEDGDPFVFAPGAGEAAALIDAGVEVEVVPGITAAIAAPGAAGIPVTPGYASSSFTVVAGHDDPDTGTAIDWEAVASLGGTIVILMGVDHWSSISRALMSGGLAPDTPAAAVRSGTGPEQTTLRATLGSLGAHPLRAPSTIVVGDVAAIDVGWLERQPLFGQRVIVTRTRDQASQLSHELRRRGAQPIEVPTIQIADPDDGGAALREVARRVGDYDWVVFTSPNGARRFLDVLPDARAFGRALVAAIGPGTAQVLASGNIVADLVPERFVAEGLLEAFPEPPAAGGRVLLARAATARDVLPHGLQAKGWDVDVVPVYRTCAAEIDDAERHAVADADVVTFTSSSTVRHFVDLVGVEQTPPFVACIGPITAATARELGITVDVEAHEHTITGLVSALEAAFRR